MNLHSTRRPAQRGLSTIRWLAGTALVAAAAGGAWWWSHPGDASGATGTGSGTSAAKGDKAAGAGNGGARRFGAGNRVQPVSVAPVQKRDVTVLLSAIGNIAASNTATVRARVDGELKSIRFAEGQQVRAGAVLAELDARTYEIGLQQAQGQLARDAAQLRNAQLDLERYKDLLSKDSIARQQVDSQDALVRQLLGTVQSDQAQVDGAKLSLSYTRVLAPISGKVGFKQADLGNVLHASDALGLVTITQTQPISVVFGVPEGNLPLLAAKLKAGKPVPVEAWDREQKTRLASGRVRSTDNAIDLATGTIKVKAEFGNADNALFPNQFVNIRLQLDQLKDALVVPSSAIQRGPQGIFVYVVKGDSTVSVRRVRLGAVDGDATSIQGEVEGGETVVTDGADRLREGARVDVITASNGEKGRDQNRERAVPATDAASAVSAPVAPADKAPRGDKPEGKSSATGNDAAAPRKPEGASGDRAGPGDGAERPRWMDRFPPDVVEKLKAMSPEDRRAYLQKMREQRQKDAQ
jgi:multidrug efflux system membrane fusion protein